VGEGGAAEPFDLAVHLLRFHAVVTSPLRLPPAAGAALRGALFGTLRARFCAVGGGPACGQAPAAADCPVCGLLAPTEQGRQRGQDVPRPYVLRVALDAPLAYVPGQTFAFTLVIFGHAAAVFPYALLGIQEVGERGLGAARAGRFRVAEVWAEHPLAGRQERLYRAPDGAIASPALPVDAADVAAEAAALVAKLSPLMTHHSALRLTLRTPARLVDGGRLLKPASFELRPLLARLLERLDALGARYGAGPTGVEAAALLAAAERVRIVERRLAWRDLFRSSARHGRQLPMGGLVGDVILEGDLAALLPWLVWGTLVHVGKDAAMGNGLLAVEVV
jgi:hypothetical protein